jgi:hypothetical protein
LIRLLQQSIGDRHRLLNLLPRIVFVAGWSLPWKIVPMMTA